MILFRLPAQQRPMEKQKTKMDELCSHKSVSLYILYKPITVV